MAASAAPAPPPAAKAKKPAAGAAPVAGGARGGRGGGTDGAALLLLQGAIKRDPESYRDEFLQRWRHYEALRSVYELKPSAEFREFADLATFLAQVAPCYPKEASKLPDDLMSLLDLNAAVMDPSLRQSLVAALILLRRRGAAAPARLLPLCCRLMRTPDKALRKQLFGYVVSDVRAANRGRVAETLNKALQAYLSGMLRDESVGAAKRALAIFTALFKAGPWADGRTADAIADAALLPRGDPALLVSALKFFLGEDEAPGEEEDDDDDDEDGKGGAKKTKADRAAAEGSTAAAMTRTEVYKATKKGTRSSKKKKQAKLARALSAVKRTNRATAAGGGPGAGSRAVMLLRDPQGVAEKLLAKLQSSGERFETKVLMMTALGRLVGAHRLLLLPLYPYLQRYLQPHQREVTTLLAAAIQATHAMVPPDALAPLLKQLADGFIHDRARPEAVAIGLHSVRELCLRQPLAMTETLLRDLVLYRKARDKAVASAARSLAALFREVAPGLLHKRDRGRGAGDTAPAAFGSASAETRVPGADLLEAEERGNGDGNGSDDGDEEDDGDGDGEGWELASDDGGDDGDEGDDDEDEDEKGDEGGGEPPAKRVRFADGPAAAANDDDSSDDGDDAGDDNDDDIEDDGGDGGEGEAPLATGPGRKRRRSERPRRALAAQAGSLRSLRAAAAVAASRKKTVETAETVDAGDASDASDAAEAGNTELTLEQSRILTPADFARIKVLRARQAAAAALGRAGLKGVKGARAQAEEDEASALRRRLAAGAAAGAVDPASLEGKFKYRATKADRVASILAGREGRGEFGASASKGKNKAGGTSNKEKRRVKPLPRAAVMKKVAERRRDSRIKKQRTKDIKGHS